VFFCINANIIYAIATNKGYKTKVYNKKHCLPIWFYCPVSGSSAFYFIVYSVTNIRL